MNMAWEAVSPIFGPIVETAEKVRVKEEPLLFLKKRLKTLRSLKKQLKKVKPKNLNGDTSLA